MRKIVLDFETASACNLKECGAWRYSEDVTTEVISLSYSFDGEGIETWTPAEAHLIHLIQIVADEADVIFVAHNAGFEKAIWRNIMVAQYGWPDIPNDRWEDTAAVCAMKALPINLDKATLALRLQNHKDKEGSRITRLLSKPNKRGFYHRPEHVLHRVYAYNRQDVLATQELYSRIGSLPPEEHKVWLLDQKINERGIKVDLDFVDAAQAAVDKASRPLIEEFKKITGGLAPTQTAKIKNWINASGVKIDSLNKEALKQFLGDEDEDDDAHSSMALPNIPPLVHRALVIRSIIGSASVKKLRRMRQCVGFDGRARGLLQYHGAGPGRWAGRLFQPHNFPRGTIKDSKGEKPTANTLLPLIRMGDPDIIEVTIGEPIETVVSSLRHALVADKDKIFLSGDFTQIEARTVLALAGQHDKTAIMAAGGSVYCDMGQAIFKRPIDKKKDLPEYQTGKNAVLGLGFQMGWPKFQLRYAKDKPDAFCQNVVDTYRQSWAPKVPPLWYGLEKAAKETVRTLKPHEDYGVRYELEDGWLTARLPSGRKLWYYNPKSIRKAMPWDKTDIRLAWTYQQSKMGQYKTIDAFGGLMTENVVQALARDLMVHAMFKLEANGFPIVLTVHDEIVCEPDIVNADEQAFKEIMQDRPQWAIDMQIPVAVETWKDERYKK